MRLSGWQRLGLILSLAYALTAAVQTHNADVDSAAEFARFSYKVCSDSKTLDHRGDLSICDRQRAANLQQWMQGSTENVMVAALAPIPFGWLFGFILLHSARAQRIGFRAVVPWATLTWARKLFVVFCVLSSVATTLFGITVIMNIYVDTKVPVALGLKATVIKTGDNFVTAEGTWTRSGFTEGSSMGDPLQTSRIECDKEKGRCTEARASVAGDVLTADLVEYDIESWAASSIVLRLDALCATEVYTIDLNTEAVTGAGHSINQDLPFCKMYASKEKSWNYRLSDGFAVYWEERKKARPLPLRLIQTLFGN